MGAALCVPVSDNARRAGRLASVATAAATRRKCEAEHREGENVESIHGVFPFRRSWSAAEDAARRFGGGDLGFRGLVVVVVVVVGVALRSPALRLARVRPS
jgi:hypothetical protein